MQNVFVEQWETFGKSAVESVRELEEMGARIMEKLADQQFQIMNTYLEASTKQLNLVTESRDYKDLFSAQAKLATEYNEKLLTSARKAAAILNDARSEFASWLEKGISNAVTNGKKATSTVTKKAA